MEDVKQRILEFIAVGRLRGSTQGKILCLVRANMSSVLHALIWPCPCFYPPAYVVAEMRWPCVRRSGLLVLARRRSEGPLPTHSTASTTASPWEGSAMSLRSKVTNNIGYLHVSGIDPVQA